MFYCKSSSNVKSKLINIYVYIYICIYKYICIYIQSSELSVCISDHLERIIFQDRFLICKNNGHFRLQSNFSITGKNIGADVK